MTTPEEQLRALPHRTLIVHGREDRVIPLETSLRLEELLDNADLAAERSAAASRLAALDAQYFRAINRDPAQAIELAERIESARSELRHADDRIARLEPAAALVGRIVVPRYADLDGTWVSQGAPLAYLISASSSTTLRVSSCR